MSSDQSVMCVSCVPNPTKPPSPSTTPKVPKTRVGLSKSKPKIKGALCPPRLSKT